MNDTAKWLSALVAGLIVSGCANSVTAPSRHTLHLAPPARFAADAGPRPSVRVDLPRYIEDQHLVRRSKDGTLQRYPNHVWAESPDEGFARLLQEQLAADGGTAGDRVWVHFSRFEMGEDAIFRALGHWQLRSRAARYASKGRSASKTPLPTDDANALLEAMNHAVRYTADTITPC